MTEVQSKLKASIRMRAYLLHLQLFEYPIQYAALGLAIHAHIDAVPVAESLRKSTPIAAMFSDLKNRVEHVQVAELYAAPLYRQA